MSLSNHNSLKFFQGDCQQILEQLEPNQFQTIIADPPYFQVLLEENWDNQWQTEEDYLVWTESWIRKASLVTKRRWFVFHLRATWKARTSLASRLFACHADFAVSRYADLGSGGWV